MCEHVGKELPMNFQCLDCEDTADECNCNSCSGVFCDLCQAIVWVDCDTIRDAWDDAHPDQDIQLEKLKTQGFISGYKSREVSG